MSFPMIAACCRLSLATEGSTDIESTYSCFTVLGVTQSSELFHCYGTNGVVRLLTCDTLKLYHKVTISSFKHLHYYSSSSIVAMHVSKSGICSVLEDSTIAIYKQESPQMRRSRIQVEHVAIASRSTQQWRWMCLRQTPTPVIQILLC